MIDYDKLRESYDLVANTGTHYLIITHKLSNFTCEINLINREGHISDGKFKDLDCLIEELKKIPSHGIKYIVDPTICYVD